METLKMEAFHTEFSWGVGGKTESRWKQARTACRELAQLGHSKPQPVEDLDTGIYLRTNKMRAFTLPDCFTHSLIPPLSLTTVLSSIGPDFPSLQGGHCFSRTAESHTESLVSSHWSATLGYQPLASLAKALGIPGIRLHTNLWSPWSSLASRIFPAARIFNFCFPGPLPFPKTTSFWHQLFFLGPQTSLMCRSAICD